MQEHKTGEKRSTHWDMLVIGSAGGRPGSVGGRSSMVMSAITNSRFRIHFTTYTGRTAIRLNGPGVAMMGVGMGVCGG